MNFEKIPPIQKGLVNVVIETPRGSQNKFDYDSQLETFRLKKTLPMGTTFPFSFGFIPSTRGEDGDPLDILVICEDAMYPGCFLEARPLGVLEAYQKEKKKKKIRNDRIVGVPGCSVMFQGIKHIKDLNKSMITEIENFFIDYNKHEGREFQPIGWKKGQAALKLIGKARTKSKRK
ncbi:MAG TPA: inorganic diphosphatase [Puia sp.]|nr:inorganic diphosphatase [Puia sp.]